MKRLNSKTELFLYHLLWTADMIVNADYRNLGGSFESWAYKNGFLRRVHQLEARDYLQSEIDGTSLERVYRLTAAGKKLAMGGRDPLEMWGRSWDGIWRIVTFDIPITENKSRFRLRRSLLRNHFGRLQQSVWITPDPIEKIRQMMGEEAIDTRILTCLEAKPCMGESALDISRASWKFDQINNLHQSHIDLLKGFSKHKGPRDWSFLRDWLAGEKESWDACMAIDPLLPRELHPKDYLGERTWETRIKTMVDVRTQLTKLKSPA